MTRQPSICALFAAAALSLGLAACPAPAPTSKPDGGNPVVVNLTPSELFGPCVADSQCPGRGAFCLKNTAGYPRGMCTKPCEDRTFCDAYSTWNWCLPDETGRKICVQKCLNGLDCTRDGYTCTPEIAGGAGSCYPLCSGKVCGSGAECNPATGLCVATGKIPPNKAKNGEGCTKDDDCASGDCNPEIVDGKPTGWIGGLCKGPCLLPAGWNQNTIFSGDVLPPGTCDANAVCYPNAGYGAGEAGTCLPACKVDGDCRPGYACKLDFTAKKFTGGICLTTDCTKTDCPAGFLCKIGRSGYVCARDGG